MAKKFILIDQSIASIAGHHYEYAVHVLEAAKRAGYEPCLATHARFAKAAQKTPWRTFPFYRFSFWAAQETGRIGLVTWILGQFDWMRFRWRLFYNYSLFGLLWAVRDRFSEFLFKQPLDRAHVLSLMTLIPAALLLKLARFAVLLLLLPVMMLVFLARSAVRLLKAGGFPQSYVRSLFADAADLRHFLNGLLERRILILQWWQQYRALNSFRKDTERLLRESSAAPGDIVFVPTLSAIELMGLASMLQGKPAAGSWHLLFRRDIFRGREADYGGQDWRVAGLRNSLQVSMAKLQGHDIRFYTDTDELTRQYNMLGMAPFRTAPIPHTHTPVATVANRKPLRLIYVGDARAEKGYHWIPRIVNDLWDDYVATGRISFHLQSNFNIPQGEPEAVIAREQLRQLGARQPGAVELIDRPMTSEQYKAFLLSGDINLLLYDTNNYYARSSGILVESLSAGVPVIVPEGSWLARQFRGAVQSHWRTQAESPGVLQRVDMAHLRWQIHGSTKTVTPLHEEMPISGAGKLCTWLRPPAGARFLLVELRLPSARECRLAVDQMDARGHSLESKDLLMEATENGEAMILLPLTEKVARLWIGFSGAPSISQVTMHLLAHDFARSAVGVAYQNPSEISGLIRELIDRHEHYSSTARMFSEAWVNYHNADRLIAELGAAKP